MNGINHDRATNWPESKEMQKNELESKCLLKKDEKDKYNEMLALLNKIASAQNPNQIKESSTKEYGIKYLEALEMAYENIQAMAKKCIKRTMFITIKQKPQSLQQDQLFNKETK